ncbi:Os03g0833500 [Oryza sativa Japonica Group]|uniref:Os03g0833500 protein n=1 Tax=Oryza sativa subsp. japonica TaxID=39947 RepID=Q0DM14_ORYSJ|nr:Os03g0833500 [Oryza sativa Japonica Group]|eukprot:NP_001051810.1 Os03g0833500 [Oryza sativa Japonica Group]
MVGAVTGFMNGVGVVVVVGSGIVTGVGSGYSGGRLGLLEYPVAGLVDGTVTMPGVTGFIAGFVAGTVTGFVAGVVVGLVTGANTSRAVVLAAAASSRRGEGDATSARTPVHLLPLSASPISLAISAALRAARPLIRNATPTPSSNAAATSATARSAFSSAPISTTTNEPDLLTNSMTLRQCFSPRRRHFAMARREGSESSGETLTLRPNPATASSA